ncbi:MAG TPA: MATE family efflux transporter [Erysipelotrichaceae bacterium]|nr:MATE family efflux transporter [Erysipelotrichaceae bacterium]
MNNEIFETMPVPKAYIKLALPVMMSSVLMLVYNMADIYFIAATGNTDIVAAVSLCAPVFTFLIAIGDILGLGGSSYISRLLGSGRTYDARRISIFCLCGSIVLGLVISLVLLLARAPILRLLGASANTAGFASAYYTWIAAGASVIIFSLVPTNLLRTEGLAAGAMIGSMLGSIVNIILDPIFISVLGMGAGGAAIATVIGNIFADIYYIYVITKHSKCLSIDPRGFQIKAHESKEVLRIGIPSSVTNIMQSIGVILLNNFLLPYGNETIAAMGIVSKITMIVIMIMVAFSFGGQPLYGYLYGAGNKPRFREVMRFAYMLVCGLGLVISCVLFAAAPLLVRLFIQEASFVQLASSMLRTILFGMPFIGLTMVTTCIFQSTGKASGALALSAGRQGYIYAVVLFILSALFGYAGVISAQPAADAVSSLLALILLKKLLKDWI